ncbi:uncharacterized protein CTRU02_200906 [Colletotrichum truncatum]|uniref:Uncharacterized protein n=1 Tax=Colletotrichum truncatum TaxID=5467 RepID=A0ACC3ZG85_COLTU|nr:uncharacterized protein CTRU02_00674 [Colletotrichum truncatum]KAF6801925.1 hypothetical protein CTRU02_00674 [Colletotrichum truncatum]
MGRSKFTFPVPGRKQKPPFGPIVSGPMSKAQKILGTAEINIDAPRQWDGASVSGISVSVTESTTTYNPTERGRTQRGEEHVAAGNNRRNTQWEQESDIVPAYLTNRFSQLNTDAGPRDFTETSSLTRRGSNSTITSWYDKSKMPLSISQQTSSSAMAKGLPQKANELLDIEGHANHVAQSAPTPKPKKKPSRLDFGPLLSRHKHNNTHGDNGSPVLDAGYVTRSPSLASLTSPKSTPPPIQQRTEKKLARRSTYDRMVDNLSSGRPRTGSSSRRGASDISHLPNLYEHYEQMTFDQVLGHDGPLAKSDQALANSVPTPLRSPSSTDPRRSVLRPGIRPHQAAVSKSQTSHAGMSDVPNPIAQQAPSADRDCASSVSSRHTKTSRASKRTSHSISGSDLMEKSVLSLSSDSEEDFFPDTVSKSTSEYQNSDAGSQAPSSLRSSRSRDAPSVAHSSRKSVKHASFAPTNTYLTIPSKSPPTKAPTPNSRTSSLPSTRYQPPTQSNRSSMYSNKSTSTTNSGSDRQARSGYSVQDMRNVPPLPTQPSRPSPERVVETPQRMLSTKSSTHSIDQPTPPLSPTSVESFTTSTESIEIHAESDSRFMAVTRQEEMLLAALRMKRARMRESVLAECEEEVHYGTSHHQRNSSQATIKEMEWPEPPQTLRHQTSATSSSTVRAGSRSSESRPASLAKGPKHTRSNSRRLDIPASSRSESKTSSRTSSVRREMPAQEAPSMEPKHERILLYLDRPVNNVSSMDFAEPSPDLSDFMDFDNGSDEEDELSSDPSFYRPQLRGFAMPSKGRGRMLRGSERGRHDSSPLRPRTKTELAEQIHVVESESVIDPMEGIPRPDSPVSPVGTLPLPPTHGLSKKKAVRLSAVGNSGVGSSWWGHDG